MSKGYVMIKEAMNTKPISVNPEETVKTAAVLMKENKIGSCIVKKDKPVGIITESDILKKVVAEGLKPDEVTVEKVMSTPLIVTDPYVDIEEAMKTMSKSNIGKLPVIEKGELIGIIAMKDILRLSPALLEISREWSNIVEEEKEKHTGERIFSGKCEECGTLSTDLREVNGTLLCGDCRVEYE